MSAAKASTAGLPGVARMSAAAASVRAGSRPVMPTRAPSAASPIAVALPMPPVPPVTRTDFPAMRGASAMVQAYPGGRPNAFMGPPGQPLIIGHAQIVDRDGGGGIPTARGAGPGARLGGSRRGLVHADQ